MCGSNDYTKMRNAYLYNCKYDYFQNRPPRTGRPVCHKMYHCHSAARCAAEPHTLSILYATDGQTAKLIIQTQFYLTTLHIQLLRFVSTIIRTTPESGYVFTLESTIATDEQTCRKCCEPGGVGGRRRPNFGTFDLQVILCITCRSPESTPF